VEELPAKVTFIARQLEVPRNIFWSLQRRNCVNAEASLLFAGRGARAIVSVFSSGASSSFKAKKLIELAWF
jgi:hypothetical protein